ncbi:MAG: (d)CMP kinase [Pseudomonadota bacterium]
MIIAIDGPAASGKGTLARRLAARFGLSYLDTGSLYRAVAFRALSAGDDPANEAAATSAARSLDLTQVKDSDLRSSEVGQAASVVAAMSAVRKEVLNFQRRYAQRPGGAVLDGRDIGTVVCPEADIKLFVTASPEERAKRRHAELSAQEPGLGYETVLEDLRARDERDRNRETAPLRPADDAHLLDTSDLDIEAAFQAAVGIVNRHLGS